MEREWEYAARYLAAPAAGLAAGRTYPWGEAAPDVLACDRALGAPCLGDDGARTRRVGSFAPSAGFFDLSGNVGEWAADEWFSSTLEWRRGPLNCVGACGLPSPRGGDEGLRPTRGRGLDGGADLALRAASRYPLAFDARDATMGLRCVRSR